MWRPRTGHERKSDTGGEIIGRHLASQQTIAEDQYQSSRTGHRSQALRICACLCLRQSISRISRSSDCWCGANLLILGPIDIGKSWLAATIVCSISAYPSSSQTWHWPAATAAIRLCRAGSAASIILDDWGLQPLDTTSWKSSTIATAGDPTYADAVLDRLVLNAPPRARRRKPAPFSPTPKQNLSPWPRYEHAASLGQHTTALSTCPQRHHQQQQNLN